MKLICINNGIVEGGRSRGVNLTIGKTYNALNIESNWRSVGVEVKNDNGGRYFYSINRFELINDYRERKLNELRI